ncbi:hypothetical protein [Novosphingobium olei]|uniref:hypothetical protein n=1 Tax=Novosphingobium olei TaxID=2728851 RepID=UPI00308D61A9|nr:hypothetical protein NSDW_11980 [Novosphingobium olei]
MALTLAEIEARFPKPKPRPFILTEARAARLWQMGPAERHMALQDEINIHLLEEGRRAIGSIIAGPLTQRAVARRWDREPDAIMAIAYAEFERVLAGRAAA